MLGKLLKVMPLIGFIFLCLCILFTVFALFCCATILIFSKFTLLLL